MTTIPSLTHSSLSHNALHFTSSIYSVYSDQRKSTHNLLHQHIVGTHIITLVAHLWCPHKSPCLSICGCCGGVTTHWCFFCTKPCTHTLSCVCKQYGVLSDIEHHVTTFKALQCRTSIKGRAHTCYIDVRISDTPNAACISPSLHANEKKGESLTRTETVWDQTVWKLWHQGRQYGTKIETVWNQGRQYGAEIETV